MADTIMFDPPCTEGVIERRRSQFTMAVAVGGETVLCHCPTTGRVGNIDLAGRPCLLSPSQDPGRKTRFTVEAVSLDRPEDSPKKWIGINQNAANRYVEHYLRSGGFEDMVGRGEVRREVFLGRSKLDFLVGDTYVEVKTPLQDIQLDIPGWVRTKKTAPFSSTDRFVRHITELADSLESHQKAVLLVDFVYDNPGFKVITHSIHYEEVKDAVDSAKEKGVEIWQANFEITAEGVALRKHFPIDVRRCRQDPRPVRSPICARLRVVGESLQRPLGGQPFAHSSHGSESSRKVALAAGMSGYAIADFEDQDRAVHHVIQVYRPDLNCKSIQRPEFRSVRQLRHKASSIVS